MLENAHNPTERVVANVNHDDAHILDALAALKRQRRMLIGIPAVTTALAVAAALLMPPVYMSTAVILPPQQQGSGVAAAMLGQLSGLAGAAGGLGGLKNPNDMYVGMLQSRSVGDALIKKFDLQRHYNLDTMFETGKKLTRSSVITGGKDGLISVVVEDRDPKLAAEMANAYVAELSALTKRLAITEASKRRVFFEGQLKEAKESLTNAEIALQNVQKKTGMLQLDGQVKGIIANTAQLQALIASREVQLSAAKTFATDNNPEILRAKQELRGLKEQLSKLQVGKTQTGDLMVPTSQIPEVGGEYIRSLRDLKYYEAIFEMLAKQFELAKVEEAKDPSLIQQLDIAQPAEKRSKPNKLLIIVGGLIGGLILAAGLAAGREYYLHLRTLARKKPL